VERCLAREAVVNRAITLPQPFLCLRSVGFEHLEACPVFKQNASKAARLDRQTIEQSTGKGSL